MSSALSLFNFRTLALVFVLMTFGDDVTVEAAPMRSAAGSPAPSMIRGLGPLSAQRWNDLDLAVRVQRVRRSDDRDPLQHVTEQLAQQVAELKAEVTADRERLGQLEALQQRHVSFSAYVSDEPSVSMSVGGVIPFRGVLTNEGGAYSPVTSAFTAPWDGRYFFILHADVSTDYRSMALRRNGVRMFAADNDQRDGHVTASGVLALKAGDMVTANHCGFCTHNAGTVDAGNESTFSGFFVG